MKLVIISILVSSFLFSNCDEDEIKTSFPVYTYCETIKYQNQSTSNKISFITYNDKKITLDIRESYEEPINSQLYHAICGYCKNIAKNQNVKFGFGGKASKKSCICAFEDKK